MYKVVKYKNYATANHFKIRLLFQRQGRTTDIVLLPIMVSGYYRMIYATMFLQSEFDM